MSGVIMADIHPSVLKKPQLLNEISGLMDEDTALQYNHEMSVLLSTHTGIKRGAKLYSSNNKIVAVYGSFTSGHGIYSSEQNFINSLFTETEKTLNDLNGSFVLMAFSPSKVLFSTDKLGSRPAYFIENHPRVSTSVAALLQFLNEKTLNKQSVSDMLLMGHLWGENTLINEVRAARPATVYEFSKGGWQSFRYWEPKYDKKIPNSDYLPGLVDRLRTAIQRTASTFEGDVGIWLSGGLDSRFVVGLLKEIDFDSSLCAYSYNANPPTGDNPKIAKKVADLCGIPHKTVDFGSDDFTKDKVERVIEVSDGSIRWSTLLNLSPSYKLHNETDILLEGISGSLVGDHLLRTHFTKAEDSVESQIMSEATYSPELINNLLNIEIDPLQSLKDEASITNKSTLQEKILDIQLQNYYNRFLLASNVIMRDVGDSRVVYVDGELLEWCFNLPLHYRKSTLPYSSIPLGTSPAKIEICNLINNGIENIKYETTKLSPSWPYPAHIIGFFTNVVGGRLSGKKTYGTGQLADFWLRNETELSNWAESYMYDAAERDLFSKEILDIWEKQQNGGNHCSMIAQITTLEYWIQKYVD